LIYDNIGYYLREGVTIGSGGSAGNVVAYNYLDRCHNDSYYMGSLLGGHGAHTYMNLYEGNLTNHIRLDDYWGSGSHHMVFRNWLTNYNTDEPTDIYQLQPVIVDTWQYYASFIGNVLGYSGMSGFILEAYPYTSGSMKVLWKVGLQCCSTTGNPTDPNTAATMIRHGNFNYADSTVEWEGSIPSHSIPNSLYLSSKPSWFGSLDWPAFGPDVTGYHKTIPAKERWANYLLSSDIDDLFADPS
jgi:hypothetical protein